MIHTDPAAVSEIGVRIGEIRRQIAVAATAAGRDPSDVRLLPVSKNHPVAAIVAAYESSGIQVFGENRVQELDAKASELHGMSAISFALIGHLQTNKAVDATRLASEFHALDSVRLASVLDRRLTEQDRTLDVFIEVNSSGEPSKFGLEPAEVREFAERLAVYPHLLVRGLMTLAVPSEDETEVRVCFERMRDLQADLRERETLGLTWDELSMGMSSDFPLAIEYGATTVRVGTAIFGAR
ncbi:MAG: YggS family pyridoxal phosphate-dependent enzyme [Propionibacteriaceae bacterium]|nr:YggS family pyridoxal phosphate-dependent enzyme [Propionibacteriaceae bacterium]